MRCSTTTGKGLVWGLALTILLGLLFTSVQAYEYAHAAFSFGGNIYGATFFMATGFHGFHVIVGTIFLIVCFFRALARPFHARAAFRLRGGGLVLALRRRGLALPLRLHLCLGLGRRDGPLMRYVVLLEDEPSKADVRPQLMPQHLAFLTGAREGNPGSGPAFRFRRRSRPAASGSSKPTDEKRVRALVEADPFYAAGLRRSVRVLAWKRVFAGGKALI